MRQLLSIFAVVIILSSCCSPHFVGYVNPLDLEEVGWEETCPLQPCPEGEECPGQYIPWINAEYERSNINIGKIGASYLGYTSNSVLSISGNYLSNFNYSKPNNLKYGVGLDTQIGFLPINNYYTTFVGLENNFFVGDNAHYQLKPTLGFAIPFPIVNTIQIETGYQFNNKSQPNFWTIGLNFKTPIYPIFM